MNEFECARAQTIMVEFVDGDLAAEQSAWLSSHLEVCRDCCGALARLSQIDSELTAWGERLGREAAPPSDQRERLVASLAIPAPARRHEVRRRAVIGLAVAAALALAVIAPYRSTVVTNRSAAASYEQFVSIPYLAPLDPRENATVVRMDIQVATLLAVGYRLTADPDAVVPADVLVGEDGRPHAVRVLSDVHLNGAGD